jgi:hypothetical protein
MSLLFFCVLVFNKKKKMGEEDAEVYFSSFDSFSDIACVYA